MTGAEGAAPTVPPRRVSGAVLASVGAGVVPRLGIEHIVVGRKAEVEALLGDLEIVQSGGSGFRVVSGRYGAGKSFLLQLMSNYALSRNFAVVSADLSPERRLTGGRGQGLATYRELVRNLSTRTRPEGGALSAVLEKWLSSVQQSVVASGISTSDGAFADEVARRVHAAAVEMHDLVHGFDFAEVVVAYARGHRDGNDALKSAALKWLRGEYDSKVQAREDLGVRSVVDDDTWYDHVKLLAAFVRLVGFSGLVVVLDEAVNLSKITQPQARANNYEKLLTILNDTLQGRAVGVQVVLGATPEMIEDERRGLYSYDALRSRLTGSRYARAGLQDLAGPVIRLPTLTPEEVFGLLRRLRTLHAGHHGTPEQPGDEEVQAFMEQALSRLGAQGFLTPRDVIRDFVGVLDLVVQNPGETFSSVTQSGSWTPTQSHPVEEARKAEGLMLDGDFATFDLD